MVEDEDRTQVGVVLAREGVAAAFAPGAELVAVELEEILDKGLVSERQSAAEMGNLREQKLGAGEALDSGDRPGRSRGHDIILDEGA